MGKIKKILSTFVLLISLFTFSITKVEAATGTVTISANKSQFVVGNTVTFTVTVKAPKNEKLGVFQYELSYDKNYLTLKSGEPSGAPVFTGNESSKTYTFKFKTKKAGTPSVKFNISGGYTFDQEKITFYSPSKSIKVITQAQLEASYSKNNNLSSLGVTGYTLSPKFSSSVTSYTVNLPANTESITITGKKADSSASVEGLGTKTVVDGSNTIKIKVTAENGSTKTYTINAVVEELNPINVTVNDIEYTVIRKAKLLESPNSSFIESTTIINEEEVPSLFNEKANMTLVGLKDSEGNIELFIYNQLDNTYTKYNQHTFSNLTLYIENKDIENYITKDEIIIDEKTINGYTIKKDSSYYYFYAINLETGIESIYRYEKDENTVQKYIEEKEEEIVITNPTPTNEDVVNEELYKYIILGLLGFIFLTYIIILFNLIFGKSNKKAKKEDKKETEEEIATPIIEEATEKQEEVKEEKKEKKSKKKKEKVTEEEKEQLQKETDEELNRIKEDNTNKEEVPIIEEDTKSKKKTKKKNKKD